MIPQLLNALQTPFTGEALFDHLDSIVFFIKCDQGKYQVVNETFVRRCGRRSKKEIVGRFPSEVFGKHLGTSYEKQDAEIIVTGQPILSRLELHVFADHSAGWCLTHKLPLAGKNGKSIGLVGVSQDLQLPRKETEDFAQVSKAVRHAETNLPAGPTVKQLAAISGLSVYQFDRRIKLVFGLNAGQWLLQLRLERAQKLLSQSDLSIATIAMDVGYADQSAFARQFRRATGLTPGQYRNGQL
jgi:AraC-like DNA-binding protein